MDILEEEVEKQVVQGNDFTYIVYIRMPIVIKMNC